MPLDESMNKLLRIASKIEDELKIRAKNDEQAALAVAKLEVIKTEANWLHYYFAVLATEGKLRQT